MGSSSWAALRAVVWGILLGGGIALADSFAAVLFSYAEGLFRLPRAVCEMPAFSFRALFAASAGGKKAVGRVGLFLKDFLVFLSGGVAFLLYLYAALEGVFRLYAFAVVIGSCALFRYTLSKTFERMIERFFPAFSYPIALILSLVLRPLTRIFRFVRQRVLKPVSEKMRRAFLLRRHAALASEKRRAAATFPPVASAPARDPAARSASS